MVTLAAAPTSVLTEDLLERCAERAAAYDRENRFFTEDFEELRQAGYLLSAVPQQFGGRGLSLADVCHEQRRLAYRSAPTALATNMHLYWTGVAADLYRAGDTSLQWLLEEAAAGEIFAAGHGADEEHGPLAVRWAPDADAMIERLAAEHRGNEQVAVVSSDEAVRGTSGAEVRKMSSRIFLGELALPEHIDRTRGDLRDKLDAETLERLERLRRGN